MLSNIHFRLLNLISGAVTLEHLMLIIKDMLCPCFHHKSFINNDVRLSMKFIQQFYWEGLLEPTNRIFSLAIPNIWYDMTHLCLNSEETRFRNLLYLDTRKVFRPLKLRIMSCSLMPFFDYFGIQDEIQSSVIYRFH